MKIHLFRYFNVIFTYLFRFSASLFGYTQWRNYNNVIDKAKESCKNADFVGFSSFC